MSVAPRSPDPRPRVLLVDDEPAVLDGLSLHLRRHFEITAAPGPREALAALRDSRSFAVVVSDMRMPGMSGAALLAQVRELAPASVRMLLTGYSEIDAAIAAVNDGQVFRFLTKPCPPDVLVAQVRAGVDQHLLVTAERDLLDTTLRGSVKVLTDLLALATPLAFGRAGRLRERVGRVCAARNLPDRWSIELAAALSQIGSVALAPGVAEKHYTGLPLSGAEAAQVARILPTSIQLLGPIPRLEPVREILATLPFRPPGGPVGSTTYIPPGARLLRIALDHDELEVRGLDSAAALATLRGRTGTYDPAMLEAWAGLFDGSGARTETREVRVSELRPGMVFLEDLRAPSGMLLVARGLEVTPSLVERLASLGPNVGPREPFRVRVRVEG